jgi:hypothetical protein
MSIPPVRVTEAMRRVSFLCAPIGPVAVAGKLTTEG